MIYEVIFSLKSRLNMIGIARYIAKDNPVRAFSFTEELFAKGQSLARMPHRFQAKGHNRRLVHGNYIILYRVNESKKRVTILAIFEGHKQ